MSFMHICSSKLRRTLTRPHTKANIDRYLAIRNFFSATSNRHLPVCWDRSSIHEVIKINSDTRILRFRKCIHTSLTVRVESSENGGTSSSDSKTTSNCQKKEVSSHNVDESSHKTPIASSATKETQTTLPHRIDNLQNYSRFYQRLAASIPHLQRPTLDDFLNVASGFWERARIRFRWFAIKSFRRFNADDISGLITWFLMSQTVWILVGTTTFFSVIFAVANSLRLQNYIAHSISNYLTAETGIVIIFESAIVPKWKDSRLSFKNVYISLRPSTVTLEKDQVHQAALGYDISDHPANHQVEDNESNDLPPTDADNNFTMFDLTVDSIDVTLSLWQWLDGKGLIKDAAVKGVRGVIDRQHVHFDPDHPLNPVDFRHPHQIGDFELESLQLDDFLVTVYQPGDFRPFTVSVFRADLHRLRKQWLLYDLLCADNIVGQFDNCLFSLHKPQSIGRSTEMDAQDVEGIRMSRIRIDGVGIDHLQRSTTMMGPVSWIKSGKVDAVLDLKIPQHPENGIPFNVILEEIADVITTSLSNVTDPALERIPGLRELARPPLIAPEDLSVDVPQSAPRITVDIDLRFRDLKAAVPMFTKDLSYVNNALIRPIVAFINANRTLVPIHCKVTKDLSDFDGSWTPWESGLMDEISVKIYEALAYHVSQANMNRRIKTVSLWSLQMTASAVLSALRNAMDPLSQHFKESYLNGQGLQIYDTDDFE